MSDTMSTLEARIAEVLAAHNPEAHYYNDDGDDHMECHGCDGKWASFHGFYAHQAAMLAPLIREAQAEAWEEGRDEPQDCCGMCPAKMCPWDDGGKGPTNPYKAT